MSCLRLLGPRFEGPFLISAASLARMTIPILDPIRIRLFRQLVLLVGLFSAGPALTNDAAQVSRDLEHAFQFLDERDSQLALQARRNCVWPANPDCLAELGRMVMEHSYDSQRDWPVGWRLLQAAANRGDRGAIADLAFRTLTARNPPGPERFAETEESLRRLGHAGEPRAIALLETFYRHAGGSLSDPLEAVYWQQRAAQAGVPSSQYLLGMDYLTGYGVAPDTARGIAWLVRAADAGNSSALRALGSQYAVGRGVALDHGAAHALWTLAIQSGVPGGHDDLLAKQRRLVMDGPEQQRASRIVSTVRAGQRLSEVLPSVVLKGAPERDQAPRQRPAWTRRTTAWSTALTVSGQGPAIACAAATGEAVENVHGTVRRRDGDRVELLCLSGPVDLDCVVPTAAAPHVRGPDFRAVDRYLDLRPDRCDAWVRGPAPTQHEPNEPPDDDTALRRLNDPAAPWLTWQTPQPLELWVNAAFRDARGQDLDVRESRLRTLLAGRQAIVVYWQADCSVCDQVVQALHKSLPQRAADGRAPAQTHLVVIAVPAAGADPARSQHYDAQWQALALRSPGRFFFTLAGGVASTLPGHLTPMVQVVDRNGLLRASTSGRWLEPGRPAWSLLTEPARLMDLALQDPVWRRPPAEAQLENVLQQVVAGRLPLAPARAPQRILLPKGLAARLNQVEHKATAADREATLDLFVTREGISPSAVQDGHGTFVHRTLADTHRDLMSFPEVLQARWAADVHTHPMPRVFSIDDLNDASHSLRPSLVALKGGHLMLALPTLDALRSRLPVNDFLLGSRPWTVRQQLARSRVGHPVPAWARRSEVPVPAVLRAAVASSSTRGLDEAFARLAMDFAHSSGLALYVGQGDVLHRVDGGRSLDDLPPWTGTWRSMGERPSPETGLEAADRLMLALLMRALAGDKEAFCSVRDEDVVAALSGFTPEVRDSIRGAARRLEQLRPELPPLRSARAGYLDDADLASLVLGVRSLGVDAVNTRLMHQSQRGCMARWTFMREAMDDEVWYAAALHPAKLLPGLAGNDVLHYDVGSIRDSGGVVAFFSPLAERYGCRGVALRSSLPGREEPQTRCPAGALR